MNKTILIGAAAVILIAIIGFAYMQSNKSGDSAMKQNSDTSMEQSMDADSEGAMMKDESVSEGVMVGGAMMTPDKDIVDNAVNSKDHTTLVAAVKAAGLVDTLKGPGPFTVFAPTNAAFEKLPAGTVESLLKPENKQKLTSVLTYHVVPGVLKVEDLTDGQTLTTVQGETLTVHKKDGVVMINDATITTPDVVSSNGVTHVIDMVLMPQ